MRIKKKKCLKVNIYFVLSFKQKTGDSFEIMNNYQFATNIILSEKCDFLAFLAERFSNISYLKQFTPNKMGAEVLILPNS